jgi:hypothetical protein
VFKKIRLCRRHDCSFFESHVSQLKTLWALKIFKKYNSHILPSGSGCVPCPIAATTIQSIETGRKRRCVQRRLCPGAKSIYIYNKDLNDVTRYFIVWRVKFNMHRTSKNANCFKTHMNTIPTTVWVSRTNVLSKQSSSISHDNLRTIRIPSYPLIFSLSCTPEEVLAEAQAPGGPSSQVITKYLTEVNFYE